ncbi:chemotaxis protein CheA [Halobacteriales archaeon QS_8_69_26]|nr:MAG: chemotaxis protein CheA [Halobacteriales archaeon QS_8_69_26]
MEEEADEPAEAATSEDEAEPAVTPPSEEALDEAVEAADPPSDPDHSVYAVRLGVVESDRHNNGVRVVEALRDAFDLLGTRPPEQEIADGEFDRTIDAVFGSHVGEAEIRSALDPVDEVAGAAVVDVSDRAPEPTAPTPDDGTSVGEFDLPDDADVDAVEEVDEEVLAAEGEIEDAHSEFKQMQAAYDEVGLDEIESELEGVSFGEPEIEEPAASGAEGPAATEAEEPVATEAEEPAVSDVEEPADPEPTETAEPADTAEAGGVEASDDDFGVDETEFGDVDVRDGEFAEVESDAGDLSEVEAGEFGEDEGFGDPDGVEFDEAEEFDDTDVDAELGGDLADADAGFDAADEPDDVAVDDVEVGEFDVGDEATGADTADEDFGEVDVGETDFGDVEVGDSGVPEDAEADVDTIRGIGPAYADRLADADVDTVGDLVESDPGTLATATGISETRVEEWIERAPVDPGDMASPADVEPADEEAAAEGFGGTDAVEPETEPEPAVEPEHQVDEIQSIRVDVTQVDDLLNMVEGLVTTRARLRRAIQEGAPMEQLEEELEELDVISSEMQDTVMEMRLVPVRAVTQRLPRVVRDIARDRGKQVRFETEGENVEVDRSILDRIGDPLVHMVRNAVDHGIESPEEREAAGKEPEGTVTLRARRDRDRITIEVEDDGRGLDPDELRQNAVEEGVLVEEAAEALDDDDAYDLIFESGFSTSEEVTEVSGRGVGMDVVASVVDELDGEVEVESTPGEGTTVRLVLPVTLAISEMLFLESGDEEYGLPVQVVDEIGAMGMAETVEAEGGGRAIRTPDGQERELIQLHDALDVPDPAATDGGGMLVTVEDDVRSCAIHCDNVRGQQEVVVKPFEGLLANIPGLGGATILGEGAVVNILDVETL